MFAVMDQMLILVLFYFFSESFYGRNAMTLGSTYRSTYSSTDYASAVRRSSLFDGYAGFSIYSSISQGKSKGSLAYAFFGSG